jgi:hypothetical protein
MAGIYWLASYPKSGNTWFRAFIKNLQDDGDTPVDINELSTGAIASARGWIDEILGFDAADLYHDEVDNLRPDVYRWALKDDEIGYHKIHDAYTFTRRAEPLVSQEATLGALYIIRNPLDVALSNANHNGTTVDIAIERMGKPDAKLCGSRKSLPDQTRQTLLSWSEHVLSWVDAPLLNCHVIRYEDMLADPLPIFGRAACFLQLPAEPHRLEKAIRFSDFKTLSKQESEAGFREKPRHAKSFFMQGKSGGWRDNLTSEQINRIVADHNKVMQRFGYLDLNGQPT